MVDEQDHALVAYFPCADVDMTALVSPATRVTDCPFKGDSPHWPLTEAPGEWAAWSYAAPHPQVAAIAGCVAFYEIRVGGAAA